MIKRLIKNRNSRLLLIPSEFRSFLAIDDEVNVRLEVSDRGPRIVIERPKERKRRKPKPQHISAPQGNLIGELTVEDVLSERRAEKHIDRLAELGEKRKARRVAPSCPVIQAYLKFCVPAGMPNIKIRDDGSPQSERIRARVRVVKKKNKDITWSEYFARASQSSFLTGKVKSFRASLPWLLKDTNIEKVEGGMYDNIVNTPAAAPATYEDNAFEAF